MPGTIVVGVDGSEASLEALRWAAEEARLRAARLVAVYAWSFIPPAALAEPGMLAMPAGDLPGALDAESNAAQAALDAAVDDAVGASAEIERRLVEGAAEEALVAESKEADLLVVGSHGRTGFRAAFLGSVSRHVTAEAACPVVVVKAKD